MKISQEDVNLIKNLYPSKQYGAQRLLGELPDKGWKLGSIDSLLNRSHKTRNTIIVPQPGALKMTDMKLQDMKMTDQVAGHEIAGHENAGHENAGHENTGHENARHHELFQ